MRPNDDEITGIGVIDPNSPTGIPDGYIRIPKNRNFCLLGAFANGEQEGAYFYASKIFITTESEDVRNKVKMANGEIRTGLKFRRKFELEIPFFATFNNYENELCPGYAEFRTITHSPKLLFQYFGDNVAGMTIPTHSVTTINVYPYGAPDVRHPLETVEVFVDSVETEFFNNHYAKKLIKLILMEKKSCYDYNILY